MNERIDIHIEESDPFSSSAEAFEHRLLKALERQTHLLEQILAKLPVYYPKTTAGSVTVT
jgi:hypothetical protein